MSTTDEDAETSADRSAAVRAFYESHPYPVPTRAPVAIETPLETVDRRPRSSLWARRIGSNSMAFEKPPSRSRLDDRPGSS
jgi:hypothetical protein